MTWLTEDPTYPVGLCLLAAAGFFVALRTTQKGKYLVWALAALALAGVVLVVERVWVTDNERIEAVVHDLRRALLASDADALLSNLTPDVQFVQEDRALPSETARAMIRAAVSNSQFDIVRVRGLQISSGRLTRRGKADFRVFVQGVAKSPMSVGVGGAGDSSWSLGFVETEPDVWKVDRITPVSLTIGAFPYQPWCQSAVEHPPLPIPEDFGGLGRLKRHRRPKAKATPALAPAPIE